MVLHFKEERYNWGDVLFKTCMDDRQNVAICTMPAGAAFTVDYNAIYYIDDDVIYVTNHDGDEIRRLWPGFFRNITNLQHDNDYLYFVAHDATENFADENTSFAICRMSKNDQSIAEILVSTSEPLVMKVSDNKIYYTSGNELYMYDITKQTNLFLGEAQGAYQIDHLAIVNNNVYMKIGINDMYYCYDVESGNFVAFPIGIAVNEYLEKQVPHE